MTRSGTYAFAGGALFGQLDCQRGVDAPRALGTNA